VIALTSSVQDPRLTLTYLWLPQQHVIAVGDDSAMARLHSQIQLRSAVLCEAAGNVQSALQLLFLQKNNMSQPDCEKARKLLLHEILPLARSNPSCQEMTTLLRWAFDLQSMRNTSPLSKALLLGAYDVVRFYEEYYSDKLEQAVNTLRASQLFPFSSTYNRIVTVSDYPPELIYILPDILTCMMRSLAKLWAKPNLTIQTKKQYQRDAQSVLDFSSMLELHVSLPLRDQLLQEVISLITARI